MKRYYSTTPCGQTLQEIAAPRALGLALLMGLLLLVPMSNVKADGPPPLMSFQTRVLDSSGNPIDGPRDVRFRIFGAEVGGDPEWAEQQTVAVKNGYISVILGQGGPVAGEPEVPLSNLFSGTADSERYIELEVAGTKISPRLRMLPTAYSFVSGVALKVVGNSIESGMLKNGVIVSSHLAGGAIGTAALADNSVTSSKIVDGTVQNWDLANDSVNSAKIANGSVENQDLANGSVSTSKISDLAVSNAKIGDGSVSEAKLANSSVTGVKIANSTITGAKIADNTIPQQKLQAFMFQGYYSANTAHIQSINTGVSLNDWWPALSSVYFGHGDLEENGSGNLGGAELYGSGSTWHIWTGLRTHGGYPNKIIRVLWIPRRLLTN